MKYKNFQMVETLPKITIKCSLKSYHFFNRWYIWKDEESDEKSIQGNKHCPRPQNQPLSLTKQINP